MVFALYSGNPINLWGSPPYRVIRLGPGMDCDACGGRRPAASGLVEIKKLEVEIFFCARTLARGGEEGEKKNARRQAK